MPEHLDAGINNSDDSFETWVSAESEFNNTSGDLMETSQSCVVTGSIPILIPIFSELHHIFLTSERKSASVIQFRDRILCVIFSSPLFGIFLRNIMLGHI